VSRRFAEWSLDGTVEVVTHGPTDVYEVFVIDHTPGLLLGPLVGYVTKNVAVPRSREWYVYDARRVLLDERPTMASALTTLANHVAALRQTIDRQALDAEKV
jgi:hypothetical protein